MTVPFMAVSRPSTTALCTNPSTRSSTDALNYIPFTCPIDTIRISKFLILEEGDLPILEGDGWMRSDDHFSKSNMGRTFSKSENRFTRLKDGLRVIVESDIPSVSVEVSLPRFLGLKNWQLRDVPDGAVDLLLDHIESEVLPNSCEVKGEAWSLSRVDLAVDFPANIRLLVGVFRFMRFKGFATYPVMKSDTRLYWPTSRGTFGLYGKTEEVNKKTGSTGEVPEGLVRFEMQLRDAVSMRDFQGLFCRSGRILVPAGTRGRKGNREAVTLDYRNLNLVIISLLLRLQPVRVPVPVNPTVWNLGLQAMAQDPMLLAAYECAEPQKSAQTIRKNRKRVEALRLSLLEVDLLELAFGLPREYWPTA